MQIFPTPSNKSPLRRRGFITVYIALSLIVFVGVSALVIDVGVGFQRRANMQKAVDATALAGAAVLAQNTSTNPTTLGQAQIAARAYANTHYGYSSTNPGTSVLTPDTSTSSGTFTAQILYRQPTLLAGIFRLNGSSFNGTNISVAATARYTAASIDIPVSSNYYGDDLIAPGGVGIPPYNYSVFGPYAQFSYGDNYSTKYRNNGDPNVPSVNNSGGYVAPDANNTVGGYNFILKTGSMTGSEIQIELYDPDTYNSDGTDGPNNKSIDEIRNPSVSGSKLAGFTDKKTKTQYSVYSDNGTPNDYTDDVLEKRATYGGTEQSDWDADAKWVTPDGFTFPRRQVDGTYVNYRINVVTIDGSSENGFNIRGGPKRAAGAAFDSSNGTSLSARDKMPLNFNVNNAVAPIPLGYIAAEAKGGTLAITKFDADVGNPWVYYVCDNPAVTPPAGYATTISGAPANAWKGNCTNGDGVELTDSLPLPDNYTGGNWTAYYKAGQADTTTWKVSATGNTPSNIVLLK